jgi:uncharacterized membrane protein
VFGFHLFNLTVHAANALLICRLTQKLCSHFFSCPGQAFGAGLTAALLFALHPVQTEAVTYISGRSSSLMTFFYLSSMLAYVCGRERGTPVWLYGVSPLLFALALMTKEVALTLPLALLLWDVCSSPRDAIRSALRRQWVHWIVLLSAVVSIAINPGYRKLIVFNPSMETLLTQVHGVTYLLSRWLYIDSLNIDPDLRIQVVWTAALAGEATVLAALFVVGIWVLRRRPCLGFGILWLFLQLLPSNTLVVRSDIASERQLYLSGVGLIIATGIEIERLKTVIPRTAARAILLMLFLGLGLFTFLRNHDYSSHIGLWENAARKSPDKARVHNNLGYCYEQTGKRDRARASYLRALELKPDYALARNNLRAMELELFNGNKTAQEQSPPAPRGL